MTRYRHVTCSTPILKKRKTDRMFDVFTPRPYPRPQPPGPAPKSQANANGAITSQAASCAPVGGREARVCRALYTSLRSLSLYSFVRPFFSYHMALALYFGIRLSSHTTQYTYITPHTHIHSFITHTHIHSFIKRHQPTITHARGRQLTSGGHGPAAAAARGLSP